MSKVKLVGVTEPVEKVLEKAEDLVAFMARVSNPENQYNTETSGKLLKYLVKNKHWSPFEMVHVVMEIETTRDIARQILRHRSFSFQEFSQRYSPVKSGGYKIREARLQDNKNRQNSIETTNQNLITNWQTYQEHVLHVSSKAYEWAINSGIAKEVARAVLPEGLTDTKMYMAGSLRSWIHYIQVRTDPSTQKEHREIALQALDILKKQFPSISDLITND